MLASTTDQSKRIGEFLIPPEQRPTRKQSTRLDDTLETDNLRNKEQHDKDLNGIFSEIDPCETNIIYYDFLGSKTEKISWNWTIEISNASIYSESDVVNFR